MSGCVVDGGFSYGLAVVVGLAMLGYVTLCLGG